MTQYLISFDPHAMDHIRAEDMPAVGEAAHAVVTEALNAGVLVFAGQLEAQGGGSIVATDGTVTDGPNPEDVGGATIVDVPSREAALDWAAKIAVACRCAQWVRELKLDPRLQTMRHHEGEATLTPQRRGGFMVEYPNELEIVTTREFDAPVGLVFDVLTKREHVRRWCATGGDEVTICDLDFRVGGDYHTVFVTPDGTECSFRGTYLEIERPTRVVNTWLFEGWPDAWAEETAVLSEVNGVTKLTTTLAFRDKAGRANMTRHDGQAESYDAMEDLLTSLLDAETVS
jgi:uncharacterized protein YndB with AHSA1/START domain